MDTQPAATTNDIVSDVDHEFDFEIEDVNELDIFATTISLCSSTCSSSSACA